LNAIEQAIDEDSAVESLSNVYYSGKFHKIQCNNPCFSIIATLLNLRIVAIPHEFLGSTDSIIDTYSKLEIARRQLSHFLENQASSHVFLV